MAAVEEAGIETFEPFFLDNNDGNESRPAAATESGSFAGIDAFAGTDAFAGIGFFAEADIFAGAVIFGGCDRASASRAGAITLEIRPLTGLTFSSRFFVVAGVLLAARVDFVTPLARITGVVFFALGELLAAGAGRRDALGGLDGFFPDIFATVDPRSFQFRPPSFTFPGSPTTRTEKIRKCNRNQGGSSSVSALTFLGFASLLAFVLPRLFFTGDLPYK